MFIVKATYIISVSSAEVAVEVFRNLESEDFRILHIIEAAMSKREFVPIEQIQKYAKLPMERIEFTLSKLNKLGLIYRTKGAYVGHTLNYAGYDCLAINTLVKAGVIDSFGQSLGVGKEADVYDALSPDGKRIAVKFHRLGRISFRQTRRKKRLHTRTLLMAFPVACISRKRVPSDATCLQKRRFSARANKPKQTRYCHGND